MEPDIKLFERPYIKLICTSGSGYVCSLSDGRVEAVSPREYQLLGTLPWSRGQTAASLKGYGVVTAEDAMRDLSRLFAAGMLGCNPVSSVSWELNKRRYTELLECCCYRLILEATEGCNLRCEYCTFTNGIEGRTRLHGNRMMSSETAFAAIAFFLKHSSRARTKGGVSIGFYGGEPFLNLKMIREVVAEVVRTSSERTDIQWHITTNGTLLSPEAWNFLQSYSIDVTVSLDGTHALHDRYRRTGSGLGTYDTIWRNLEFCRATWPRYYDAHISFNVGIAPPMDFQLLREAAMRGEGPLGSGLPCTALYIALENCPNFVAAGRNEPGFVQAQMDELVDRFLELRLGKKRLTAEEVRELAFLDVVVGRPMVEFVQKMREPRPIGGCVMLSSPCDPGVDKLFVTVDGEFRVCEKCHSSATARIGDVKTGICMGDVNKMLEHFFAVKGAGCRDCWALRFCSLCFTALHVQEGVVNREAWGRACDGMRQAVERSLTAYCRILEYYPDYIKELYP